MRQDRPLTRDKTREGRVRATQERTQDIKDMTDHVRDVVGHTMLQTHTPTHHAAAAS
jgi:hypothetical protein